LAQAKPIPPAVGSDTPRQPEDRTASQVAADQRWLAQFRACPACGAKPCVCTDEATDLRLEEEFFDPGADDEQPPGEQR
jgi:hypothetical protein